jgi:hypothetical protein
LKRFEFFKFEEKEAWREIFHSDLLSAVDNFIVSLNCCCCWRRVLLALNVQNISKKEFAFSMSLPELQANVVLLLPLPLPGKVWKRLVLLAILPSWVDLSGSAIRFQQ